LLEDAKDDELRHRAAMGEQQAYRLGPALHRGNVQFATAVTANIGLRRIIRIP